jgi:hypothetical protein
MSNFKLFSKTDDKSSSPITGIPDKHSKYLWIFAFCLVAISAFIYYNQDELTAFLSGWVSKLWLDTHLTSTGELASTYVPAEFSGIAENVPSAILSENVSIGTIPE